MSSVHDSLICEIECYSNRCGSRFPFLEGYLRPASSSPYHIFLIFPSFSAPTHRAIFTNNNNSYVRIRVGTCEWNIMGWSFVGHRWKRRPSKRKGTQRVVFGTCVGRRHLLTLRAASDSPPSLLLRPQPTRLRLTRSPISFFIRFSS